MKLWDVPESNNITAGVWWIENVHIITGVALGSSARVVKLIRPCLTWIVCFLPLFLLSWWEPWPWFGYLACGHSRANWFGLQQLKQRSALLGRIDYWIFGLGLVCCGVGGITRPCYYYGGLITHRPYWGAFWGSGCGVLCTGRYISGWALKGPADAFLFFSARWATLQSFWVISKLSSSLYVSTLMGFRHSLSLVFRPRRKRSAS